MILNIQLFKYINHPKLNLNLMFPLNFGTIYLFEYLILVEVMRSDDGFTTYF